MERNRTAKPQSTSLGWLARQGIKEADVKTRAHAWRGRRFIEETQIRFKHLPAGPAFEEQRETRAPKQPQRALMRPAPWELNPRQRSRPPGGRRWQPGGSQAAPAASRSLNASSLRTTSQGVITATAAFAARPGPNVT